MAAPLTGLELLGVLAAAAAGGLAAVAAREAVVASPSAARWLAEAVEPLRRAGNEGYAPTAFERRRLAVLGTLAMLSAGVLLLGPGPAPLLAVAGPTAAGWAVARRRRAYRRAVERGLAEVAVAVADALVAARVERPATSASATATATSASPRSTARR